MPRITVGNKEIVVNFQHGTTPSNYNGKRHSPDTDYTKCVILSGEIGCRDENKESTNEVEVRRNFKDTPNLKHARLEALHRAINQGNFSKEERAAIYSTIRISKAKRSEVSRDVCASPSKEIA